MSNTCPCGDFLCMCVRPCRCCSCTCWCSECRLLRKGHQFCDLCRDATINKASMCGVVCRVTHDKSLSRPEIRESLSIAPIIRRVRGEASGTSSNAEAAAIPGISAEKNETDEDSDEPMLEIDDDRCKSSQASASKSAEGRNEDELAFHQNRLNNIQSCLRSQMNENLNINPGCSLFNVNRMFSNPIEVQLRVPQRSSNANSSKLLAQESESNIPQRSQSDEAVSTKREESQRTETTSVISVVSPKTCSASSSTDDSTRSDDKFFGFSSSSRSQLSISESSAFSIPKPYHEQEPKQIPAAKSKSLASVSRRLTMLRISNAHSADQSISESNSSVKLLPEKSASGESSEQPAVSKASCILNESQKSVEQRESKSESPIKIASPENVKSAGRKPSSGPNSPAKALVEQSSEGSEDENTSSSNTDNVSRKC